MIHPDKNNHPLAESVFKKLKQSYDAAKNSLKHKQRLQENQQ